MNRNALPRWINRAIDWIADHPTSALGRLAAHRLGRPGARGATPETRFDAEPVRVAIGPVNYSGQGREWARALEQQGHISARNFAVEVNGGFSFGADLVVPRATYHNDGDWQQRQLRALTHATHVLIEAEEPPVGRLFGRSLQRQVGALREGGVSVAFLAHGTDVRLPSRHMQRNRWSHYRDSRIYVPRAEQVAARNIAFLEHSGAPLFVSTPDLVADLPTAHWVPVVVDPERWAGPRARRDRRSPIRVAHAPSVQTVKGTELVMPTLESLEREGVVTLDLIEGLASAEMPARLQSADVVLDQFRIGSYGVAACEAMAAGCVVVGHVADDVRSFVEEQAGQRVPIVEATADSLEQVLRELAAAPDLDALAAKGEHFVQSVHDGRRSAKVLLDHWIAPHSAAPRPQHSGEPA